MIKESEIWKQLKYFAEKNNIKMYRIENAAIPAMPDIHYICTNGVSGWIENKIGKSRSNGIIDIVYRPGQQAWLRKYNMYKGNAYMLCRVHYRYFLMNTNFVSSYSSLNSMLCISVWHGLKFEEGLYSILSGKNKYAKRKIY